MALQKAATSQDRHDSAMAQKKVKLGWCVDKYTTRYVFKCNNIFYKESQLHFTSNSISPWSTVYTIIGQIILLDFSLTVKAAPYA